MPATDSRDHLDKAVAIVVGATTAADGEAAALLGALGLPSAVLVTVLPGRTIPAAALPFVTAGAAGLATAMVLALLCILPRLGGILPGSWIHWATCDPDQITPDASTGPTQDTVQGLARIALRKHQLLRAAVLTAIAAVIALALATATAGAL
ncbi:hypothetical protein E1265_25835 [Streptomyces sp. 8K308]|uniref:Pycsar system effector family protein n=1 Tax=Streptomyces sp. 8K308 TaxID=2530388 RepID=UPI001047FFC1|nr:Pycsar system effector family protein [Streptomyces sp. 8K308]TDC17908.1 hypothetical protein E1265_25835 [Streptomyces sp. 8K308]